MPQPNTGRYEQLAATLHHLMSLYGYVRLETPVLQPAELFLTRAGDQVIASLFTFERNGKQLALRPEYTSSALNYYIALKSTATARWQFGGLVFAEAEDAGRQQHHSIGAEVYGLPEGLADSEIIHLALTGLERAELADGHAYVGHIGLLRLLISRYISDSRLQRFLLNHVQTLRLPDGEAQVRDQLERLLGTGLAANAAGASNSPSPAVMDALLQSLERTQLMGGRTRADIQRRLQRKLERAEARPQLDAALRLIRELLPLEGDRLTVVPELQRLLRGDADGLSLVATWDHIVQGAETLGAAPGTLILAPALSRNWDYYTGMVFELRGGGQHLGGGGRYDELARLLGSPVNVPAVGFAYYVDNLLMALPAAEEEHQTWTLTCPRVTTTVRDWLTELRARGVAVALVAEAGRLTVDDNGRLHTGDRVFTLTEAANAVAYLETWS